MTNYPLLDIFLSTLYFFIWILWIMLLFWILMDIFRSDDLSGWGKAGWVIFVIILPFLGVFVYLIARPRGPAMQAITVAPGEPGSVDLTDMPEPPGQDGPVVVRTQAIGVCGTDLEIINGEYGWAPPGEERLIIGHESIGDVIEAEPGT